MDRNPGKIHAGALLDFDPNVISYWSQWLGHPRPQILVVGQDFGDIGYFKEHRGKDEFENETNNNLYRLLVHIGLKPGKPPREDRETRVFLTNSILCLKDPPMNAPVRDPWVRACAETHLRPLVLKLKPPVVVAMGRPAWLAARCAFELADAPANISAAAGGPWKTKSGILAFAVAHCSGLGIRNRPWERQLEDWSRIGKALKQLPSSAE